MRCAAYYKCLDKEFEFRLVESEEFEYEVVLISVPVSGSLKSSDFVVDTFHGTARDRMGAIPNCVYKNRELCWGIRGLVSAFSFAGHLLGVPVPCAELMTAFV